jgi:membrane fusion protein (multidrug efflux system)
MENQEEKNQSGGKRRPIVPILITLVILALAYGVYAYIKSQGHEETDNAQIDGAISPISPRVAGYVLKVNVVDNQLVQKGDTLFIIDPADLAIRVTQAQAALENAVANLEVVKATATALYSTIETNQSSIEFAKANVDNAKIRFNKANQDFIRYENLLQSSSVTRQQYDGVKADKESAEAQLNGAGRQLSVALKQAETARTQYLSSEKQIPVAKSVVAQRQSDLDNAKLQLSYAYVCSPVEGNVTKKTLQVGQLVQAGQMLFSIVKANDLWVTANFKETQLKKMKVGQRVEIVVDGFKDTTLEGEINSFSKGTGSKFALLPPDNATGNFVKVVQRVPVKIIFKDESHPILKDLKVGMNVKVDVSVK